MKISKKILETNTEPNIIQLTLENDCNMKVQILTLGASIQSIELPFSDGTQKNVVMSYKNWEDFQENPVYLGATLAPNAGRIAGAILPVNDTIYTLSTNDGKNNSHGGFHNASRRNWTVVDTSSASDSLSITLSITLPDGLDGYPGERIIQTCYTLSNDNTLTIHYQAITDKATYLNISNHAYFNLSGDFKHSGLEQQLEINAIQYVVNDHEHLPAEIVDCSDSPFDFRSLKSIAENISNYPCDKQFANALGYNNAFILNNPFNQIAKALRLYSSVSEYSMELYTDAPSVVVYSGEYFDDSLKLSGDFQSSASCAIALEAQDTPNTPNFMPELCKYTTPDVPYERTIAFKFIANS